VETNVRNSINEALNNAIAAQRIGGIREATEICELILKERPDHPDANHNMGVVLSTNENSDEAIGFFKIAIKANPNVQQYCLSCINFLIKLNRLDEAQKLYEEAEVRGITRDPFEEIKYNLKNVRSDKLTASVDFPEPANFTTKQVAEKAGVHRDTLLRWLRAKSVAEPRRDRKGWRVFTFSETEAICYFARKETYYQSDQNTKAEKC
jgi:tetratricopeptide (TPR) repeat protein